MIRCGGATALALAATCLCASGRALGAGKGRIEGRITPPGAATRVSAVDRNVKVPIIAKEVPVREHKGRLLDDGSRYEITVPPGTYDLHFETTDGLKIEGADLRAEGNASADPLKERDLKSIRERVRHMRTFENERSVLAINGAGKRAKVLVKLVRTKPTSYDGDFGEPLAIFRWEVWNFRKYTGSWLKERKYKVLRRFMVAKRKMHELRWDFRPELGGIDVEAGSTAKRDAGLASPASRKGPKQDTDE
ncbi:MAG: hypothetical protein ACYTFI_03395 [Planctomycetota bacterium]|jgi:hypothetical protein